MLLVGVVMLALLLAARPATAAPTFFDPAETPGLLAPFTVLYATKIQQRAHERLMFIPVMETPRFAYSAPYEDLSLKKK